MRTTMFAVFLIGALRAQEVPGSQPPTPAPAPAPAPAPGQAPVPANGDLDERAFAALHHLTQEPAPPLTGAMVKVGGESHYLSLPKDKKAPLPAVLLIHEWWGLNDHIKHWADRLAAEGYATLAVDLYGGKVGTTPEEAQALMKAVDPERADAVMKQAFEYLAADTNIQASTRATLGWCFGGGVSLQFAMSEPRLDACVLYYGHLPRDPARLQAIAAPVLGIFGTQDPSIPKKAVDDFEAAMQKAGKKCRVLRYDAQHAFANPSNAHYDAANAAKAWTEVRLFLRENMLPKPLQSGEAHK
ncbi:MAG TPA: dienelactone hydrolase family protein [Planctomycetota bacterium]|nr:dienelactone hydrolase family protein [Planctomycetota bacterium]